MQLVSERLFGLRSEILARICLSQIWQSAGLTLENVYALVATVRGSPTVRKSREPEWVWLCTVDGQLKVWKSLLTNVESGECACL